jgi:predicted TPR repeat methyltransferase
MSSNFDQAREFFMQGLAHFQAGRYADAERDYAASLALLPGRGSTLTNLGATRLILGRPAAALEALDEAVAAEPDNEQALGHRATALAELGQSEAAMACVDRLLQLAPRLGHAWSLRGRLLKERGERAQAASAFSSAIAYGADAELNGYFLASVSERAAPAAPPRHYVENLFDGYADDFDQHLVGVLKYQAHEVLVGRLRAMERRFERALDLGCGTGLCGALVRPLARWLEGVDLSSKMVAQARARGIYDELRQADLVEWLGAASPGCDLVIAADVFIYVGALDTVFASVARLLDAGGVFCFSVEEAGPREDFAVRPSLRYVHSPDYLRRLAARNGFELDALERHPIRQDQQVPIPGLFAWFTRH